MTELALAIEQFNNGEYFEQHETLERMWRAEAGPVRELYQGILQIGVGFYHLQRGNHTGALHLLERGLQRLAPLAPVCLGIDVARLIAETERCIDIFQSSRAHSAEVERSLIPHIHFSAGDG